MSRSRARNSHEVTREDLATLLKPMPGYRELLQQVKSEIEEVDGSETTRLLDADEPPLLVDVRERDEWDEGHIAGAIHVTRGNIESRIEQAAPDRDRPLVLYCASGNRSAF